MSKYFNYFEDAFYINRLERTDRNEAFLKKAYKVGLYPKRQLAVEPEGDKIRLLYEGHVDITRKEKISCTMSHQAIISKAKENKLKNVLIFEDDCLFLDGFKETMYKVGEELGQFDWDILYMGGEPNNYLEQVSENLYTMKERGGIYCLHAYAINHTFYDKVLSADASRISILDNYILNMSNHERKLFATSELLAVQDYTYSDIWNYMTDSDKLMINGWDKYIKKLKN